MVAQERQILEDGGDTLAAYIWQRFEVRVFPGDCTPAKGKVCPVEWISYRLRDAGYFEATGVDEPIEAVLELTGKRCRFARTKIFRTNLRVQPIDLVSWIVSGCPLTAT